MKLFLSKQERAFNRQMKVEEQKQSERIRRREFCISQAAFVCNDKPFEVAYVASQIYEWIYGEKPE